MSDEETNDQQTETTTDVQSTSDQAGEGSGTGVEGDEAAEVSEGDGPEEEGVTGNPDGEEALDAEIISQKEYDRLKDDPAALRAALHSGATKKFQQLAATRQALEPYADFIRDYQRNPRQAAASLAESLGLEVKQPKTEEESEAAVKTMSDQIRERVREALGPEYEDIADKIGAAITNASSLIVNEAVRPLKEGQEKLIAETAGREATQALDALTKRHPDWRKHEKKMFDLSRKIQMVPGEMSEAEYLDSLYALATADGLAGDAAKKAAKRMNASAKKAAGERSVPASAVTRSPAGGKLPSFGEAAAAARRGERFD